MRVTNLGLKNYRNLQGQQLELLAGINIFCGDNAQGKTNILEAIYLCATGRARRTRLDKELITTGHNEAYISLGVMREQAAYSDRIDIHLREKRPKGIAINGLAIHKLAELFGTLLCVIFTPEDLTLIKEGPAERRRFLDMEMCQISQVYVYHLQTYHHVLKQRNSLLKSLKGSKSPPPSLQDTLSVWDEQLGEHGTKIYHERKAFVEEIATYAQQAHNKLSGESETLDITYRPNVHPDNFRAKLAHALERDIALGSTSVGIHKDDLHFSINGADARIYASQGQQRTAVLCAKLALIKTMTAIAGSAPVLLLDDVFSELDEHRQAHLMQSIGDTQAIITCTGVEDILRKMSREQSYTIFRIENGFATKL